MVSDSYLQVFEPETTIFKEGEAGDTAYIVDQGEVDLFAIINGEKVRIAKLKEGELFGEMSLIDNQLRSATAIAVKKTSLIVIPKKYVEDKIDLSDRLISTLLKVVLERYREMRGRLADVLHGRGLEETADNYQKTEHEYEEGTKFTAERLQAENSLREAYREGQLELFFQPIISLSDKSIAGCESLIRWRKPDQGLIPPLEFIGLAEETGLIVPIGLWIIEEATRAQKRFQEISAKELYVSINLSGRQFESGSLASDIEYIFKKTSANTQKIKLEITETLLMSNPLNVANILHAVKGMGADIAIDDFGTGYSSFSYLHRFPIDTLKIDQSFVLTMRQNPKSLAIVRSLCSLAKSLGISVIAEGIEQLEDAQILNDFNADFGQGYYFGKPMPENEFVEYIKQWTPM